MQYDVNDVKKVTIRGSKMFDRRMTLENAELKVKNVGLDQLEEILKSSPFLGGYNITADLPVSLYGRVLKKGEEEIVRLISGAREINLKRDCHNSPGDIIVSCPFQGKDVPVSEIHVNFREFTDKFTDRGMIWLRPGNPATMRLCIKEEALEEPGLVPLLVRTAYQAVHKGVLRYF